MALPKFERLIRFADSSGQIHLGELPGDHPWNAPLEGVVVALYDGASPLEEDLKLNGQMAEVKHVLCPLPDVPFIYGVGLNYRRHAEEGGHKLPAYPKTFVKYSDAMTGPYNDVVVHPMATEVDYEGELVFIMGRTVKNVPAGTDSLPDILAYTIGNDLSSRYWQDPNRGGNQSNYAKSFDGFAPLGPVLVSSKAVPDPAALHLRTLVNGEKRQDSGIDDLIFDVSAIVHHLSQGRTLRRGAVVMTGTPSGVGSFQPGGPKFLKDGDEVEIQISQIGRIKNKFVFEKA